MFSPFGFNIAEGPTTTRLQMVYMPVVDNEECARAYALKSFNITNKQLCAGTAAGDKDSCQVIIISQSTINEIMSVSLNIKIILWAHMKLTMQF